ncbi:GNAT family N-acetyltransferase [Stratiformator vulcanicus]|uniref:Putative acetyltransferase n=1 Tax=Stratiformator vulcanicus TaxID=2527980 RepID=A0A517R4Z1_9PLAN|nr:GNAT family N-acetyltransferase [Stratiformator vulcanicus]QDT38941.1 putative acetyltransferase [Stratiformator vulcanicus]
MIRLTETNQERSEALGWMIGGDFCDHAAAAPLLNAEDAQDDSVNRCFGAFNNRGEVIGGVLGVVAADGTGMTWIPGGIDRLVRQRLLQAIADELVDMGAAFSQVLLQPPLDAPNRDLLAASGFQFGTSVQCLGRELGSPVTTVNTAVKALPSDPPSRGPRFRAVAFSEFRDETALAELLERTYIDSLDCPLIAGLRSGRQAISAMRETGIVREDRWFVYLWDDAPVGTLLANDTADGCREIVYLGVDPNARRRGLGHQMLSDAVATASADGCLKIGTQCDDSNYSAIRLYGNHGFSSTATHHVFFKLKARRKSAA